MLLSHILIGDEGKIFSRGNTRYPHGVRVTHPIQLDAMHVGSSAQYSARVYSVHYLLQVRQDDIRRDNSAT